MRILKTRLKKIWREDKPRKATIITDKEKGTGYNIAMLDGKKYGGSTSNIFAWYRYKKDAIASIKDLGFEYVEGGKRLLDKQKRIRIAKVKSKTKLKLLELLKK